MKIRGKKQLKIIDRYLGIPIVFINGLIKKKNEFPEEIKKIGVLLTPAIGDTILFSAPLKDLKAELDPELLILFVPIGNEESAELIDIADEVISLNLAKPFDAVRKIRTYSFDLFIDSSQWSRTNSLLTSFSNSKFKIGFDTKGQHRKYIYDLTVKHSNQVHEIFNFRNLISLDRIQSHSFPTIKVNTPIDRRKISIHLKAGGYLPHLKEWQHESWISVIEYLLSKGFSIYFTGGKSDFDFIENLLNKLASRKNTYNKAGHLTLRETAAHLKSCTLVLSVNTGIMHLASAVGANLIALHGPTNPDRWGPLNNNSIIIRSSYSSAPCLNLGFEYNCKDRTGECMKAIQVSEIIDAIKSFTE